MKPLLVSVLDYLLPRFCFACRRSLTPREKVICGICHTNIKKASKDLIRFEYKRKFETEGIISDFISLYLFEKDKELQNIIHALKYNKRFIIGIYLGGLIGSTLEKEIKDWNIDYIIPVPLHKRKVLERGYNQSFFIAKGLKCTLQLPLGNRLIKRIRYTGTQTSLTKAERDANMRGAFKIKKTSLIKNKRILLVDDVITTGATISECGRELLKCGALQIYAASVGLAE